MDPNTFVNLNPRHQSILVAKAICQGCPVKEPCLDYALGLAAQDIRIVGVWGGRYFGYTAAQGRVAESA